MPKLKHLVVFLFFNSFLNNANAQKLNKKIIASSNCYINNQDSSFFKKDTLNIVMIEKKNISFKDSILFKGDYVLLDFRKKGLCYYSQVIDNYIGVGNTLPWYWKFNKKSNTIQLYEFNHVLLYTLKLIQFSAKHKSKSIQQITALKIE